MAALAFLLECAATAALIGLAVSLLVWPTLLVLRGRALQRVPALRAELAFVLGTLPALASVGGGAAAAAPPLAAALGLAADHCLGHGHHVHLAAPFLARACAAAYQTAAEEACDAEAAAAVGDGGLVAGALVKVAALQRRLSNVAADAPAFGALELERRVRLLLDDEARATTAYALRAAGAVALAAGLLALEYTAFLHHAVETALHLLF